MRLLDLGSQLFVELNLELQRNLFPDRKMRRTEAAAKLLCRSCTLQTVIREINARKRVREKAL